LLGFSVAVDELLAWGWRFAWFLGTLSVETISWHIFKQGLLSQS
jgi:hypothetical protein